MAKALKKYKQTPEYIAKLEHAFSMGCTAVDACIHAGIGETTYYRWCDENEALRDRFKALQSKQVLKARAVINDALYAGDVNTAKWLLERKRKAEFSTQVNQEVDAKLQVHKIEHVIVDPKPFKR